MKEELVNHIGYKEICDFISKTNRLLILCLPNIDKALAHAIVVYKKKNNLNDIKVIMDNSENNFRNGFGEIDAIELLKQNRIEIYELPGNMVSFIIYDDGGYFLFPQSKIFTADDDLKSNAVRINPIDLINLKNYFFPPKSTEDKEKIQNEILEKFKDINGIIKDSIEGINNKEKKTFLVESLNDVNLEQVKKSLQVNPPDHPDLKRKLNTYISKIQFVEIEFKGSNFKTKDILIPPKALPYKDENLRKKLLTKMKLFDKLEEKKNYKSYIKLNQEYKQVKEKYLKPITCRKDKSILETKDRVTFLEEINKLKKRIPEVNNLLNELLQKEIMTSRDVIKKELHDFLMENPPQELKKYKNSLFNKALEEEVNNIIYKIKFPGPEEILQKLGIEYNFYDLTIEDFRDNELLKEFSRRGILGINKESIVEFNNVFGVKK